MTTNDHARRLELLIEIKEKRASGLADRLRAAADRDRRLLDRIATPPAPIEEITFR